MSAEMRYTAFQPQIFLMNELRGVESRHFMLTNGFDDRLVRADGGRENPEDLMREIMRLREMLKRV